MRKTKLIAMLLCMTMILAMTASFTVSAASDLFVSGIRVPVNDFQPITQDIHIDYLPNEIAIEEGTGITIRTYVDVDLMLSSNIKYQWCMTKSNIHGTGVAIVGANAKDLTVPSNLAPGTYYFYLNMSCTFDGRNYSSDHSDASLAKVIVYSAEDAPEFDILPVGDTEVSVYDCETPVTLQVKTVNAGDEDVVILWHRSDEHGNILTAYNGGNPVSTTNTLTIDDMTYDEMMVPRYYRCMAQAGDTMKYTVYSVTLYPMGVEVEDEMELIPVGDLEVHVYDPEATVTLQAEVINAGDNYADYQWYRCDEDGNILKEYNYGHPLSMGNTLTISDLSSDDTTVPRYYRCHAMVGGTMLNTLIYTVTLLEERAALVPVGDPEVNVYDPEATVTLEAEVINADGRYADFQWYRCDEDGNTLKEYNYGHPLSMGPSLTISDLSADDMLVPRYYRCHAMIGGTMLNTLIYTVTLREERAELVPIGDPEVNVYDPEATVTLQAEVINADGRYADFQWYRCDEDGNILKEFNYGHPLSMGNTLTISDLSSDDMLAPRYYRCHAMIGGTMLNTLIYTVTLREERAALVPVGDLEVSVYDPEAAVTLEAEVINADGRYADFQWFRCDEDGNTLKEYNYGHPLSMGPSLTISDLTSDDMLVPRYYRCHAMIGGTMLNTLIYSVTLNPMGVEEEEYVFPFTDFDPSTKWSLSYVEAAHQMGLINGRNETTYAPKDELLVCEAVKLAVCMNILYNGGNPNTDIQIGKEIWYSTYMAYAAEHGITDGYLDDRAYETITREEYVYIFSRALPDEAFPVINRIPAGSIPDVPNCENNLENAIYKFYRAGITIGTDEKGTFNPNSNITRAEVATILVRMMDPSFRAKK
ncbi:MAG: S-layer homology domain-containing protein [Ruminococcaceae bacterium]|nr:S-layer homology domain-containing protein [Oscillospiraceae bacterium]